MTATSLTDELLVLAEHLPFDVWVRDREDRCIYANATALRHWPGLVGQTPETSGSPPEVIAIWRANNDRALRGEIVTGDVVYDHREGRRVVRNIIAPVVNGGHVVGTVGVNIDVTSEREAEGRARDRDGIIRAMFDAARALMGVREIVGDDDILHLADNPLSLALYGRETDVPGDVRDSELGVPREYRVAAIEVARAAARRGRPLDFEVTYAVPGRGPRTFSGKVAPLARSTSGGERFLYFAEDVTDLKALEGQLLRAERLASLGTLAASIAHEIKNPALTVLANVQLARAEVEAASGLPFEVRGALLEMLRDAEAGTDQISRLVKDLGKLARPGEDLISDTDLDEVVRSALSLGRAVIAQHAQIRLDLGAPKPVLASAVRLAQVILNLTINAAEAAASGGKYGTITVRTRSTEAGARLEIEDDGPGLPADVKSRLFQPFVSGKPDGSGLGLYICRQIVVALGGSIEALDRAGGGTIVRIELPRAPAS